MDSLAEFMKQPWLPIVVIVIIVVAVIIVNAISNSRKKK